jgi:hypothetical protein
MKEKDTGKLKTYHVDKISVTLLFLGNGDKSLKLCPAE